MMATEGNQDLRADAKNFCESLTNVFMRKRRDPQTQNLMEKAKNLIEALLSEKLTKTARPSVPPKPSRAPGTPGQLWVKLDELKRENDELKKRLLGKGPEEKGSPGKSQGPGDVIIAELHKTKMENETFKAQLEKAHTLIKELEKVNENVQDEFKRTKIAQDMAQKSLEKIRKEQKNLESSLNSVQTENDSLKKRLTNSVKPMKRSTDNRFVENINEKCRPSNIAVHYTNLESQEWVDAKESLEDAGYDNEEAVTQFLCAVLVLCYDISTDLLVHVGANISDVLKNPCTNVSEFVHSNCAQEKPALPEEMINSIKEILRQHVDGLDAESLVNTCKEKLLQDSRWNEFEYVLNNKPMLRYMEQCVRITWQMVVQQTPMCLSTSDPSFDDEIHKLWWSCSQSNAKKINYFVWPGLYDFKNGNLMVKGCVHAS